MRTMWRLSTLCGVPSYVDDQGKVYLNTPEGLAAAEWIRAFQRTPKETSHDICRYMLLEGQAAAVVD
ncbi:hypothetical protein [Candidatus Amarolinea dominans]|uniref:hypothetical protein n=1 Tax=Candidatus Amarolinea dominans TaxID=3140696 RepID=UPI0031CCACFE